MVSTKPIGSDVFKWSKNSGRVPSCKIKKEEEYDDDDDDDDDEKGTT